MKLILLLALSTPMSQAANYTAQKTTVGSIEVVKLTDGQRRIVVTVVPSMGNNSYSMTVNGKEIFYSPAQSLADWKAKPAHAGNPLLAPWANRLDQDAFFANGKKYILNPDLKNFGHDGNRKPIHGLLVYAPEWRVTEVKADANSALVTSRLEFWRYPDYMAQFPFAHNLVMTYKLANGELEVETVLENLSTQTMPVSLGYHPYFKLSDSRRDDWKVHLPAKEHVKLSNVLIPTGEQEPNSLANPLSLAGTKLDDVFANLQYGANGRAEFSVQGAKEKITVGYSRNYPIAVVYAPPGREFICFEPMSGPTNAFNLAHAGIYKQLQTIPAGGQWKASFWITPSGF